MLHASVHDDGSVSCERKRSVHELLREHDGDALGCKLTDDLEELDNDKGREPHRDLVQKKEARPAYQSPRHGEHLLLTARQGPRELLAPG